jgi:hypothetical protein
MSPTKAKDIISEYFEKIQLENYEYWSGWENIDDDFSGYTHFLAFDIKQVDGKILIYIISRNDSTIKHIIDITVLTPEEVVDEFSSYYEEIRKQEAWKEYQKNYPDGSFEH